MNVKVQDHDHQFMGAFNLDQIITNNYSNRFIWEVQFWIQEENLLHDGVVRKEKLCKWVWMTPNLCKVSRIRNWSCDIIGVKLRKHFCITYATAGQATCLAFFFPYKRNVSFSVIRLYITLKTVFVHKHLVQIGQNKTKQKIKLNT